MTVTAVGLSATHRVNKINPYWASVASHARPVKGVDTMTLYVGVCIGFLIGTFAGITLTAVLVAAREESRRVLSHTDENCDWKEHMRRKGWKA